MARGYAERDAGWPAGNSAWVLAGSLGKARSSWLRELTASLANLPRWYWTVRAVLETVE